MNNLFRLKFKNPIQYTKECVHVKKTMLVKQNKMVIFDGKYIQTLVKYLNHLYI